MITKNKIFVQKLFFSLLLLSCLFLPYINASGSGTTAAQFLKLSVGARADALGESFVGLSDDINSIYWNPAGLVNIENFQMILNYAMLYENIYYGFLGFSKNLSLIRGSVGASVLYLGMDKIKGYDNYGNPLPDGDYTADDSSVGLSYAQSLTKKISVGITFKSIEQKIEKEKATGFAVDIAGLYKPSDEFSFGLNLQNLGSKIGFYEKFDLPTNIKFGFGYHPKENVVIVSDINIPFDYTPSLHAGIEYVYRDILALRFGLKTKTMADLGVISGLSCGIGIKIEKINFDYAFLPYGELGMTHRISILIKL